MILRRSNRSTNFIETKWTRNIAFELDHLILNHQYNHNWAMIIILIEFSLKFTYQSVSNRNY